MAQAQLTQVQAQLKLAQLVQVQLELVFQAESSDVPRIQMVPDPDRRTVEAHATRGYRMSYRLLPTPTDSSTEPDLQL
eukprot:gene4015-14094_t